MTRRPQQFASDNYAGICPEAMKYLIRANENHEPAYGEDRWTRMAADQFRDIFETDCEVFFVFNGTAANSLALATMCRSYNSVITHSAAHVETDECGAPEFFSNGVKILLAQGENGKLTPGAIEMLATKRSDIHYPKPKVVSITQATELGTVYSVHELKAIHQTAQKNQLKIHMDGARFANSIVSLGVKPREITYECGVDVLCFGGVKNGLANGEAVVFFDKDLALEFEYRCKQAGQLASKMRFLTAPWFGLLENGTWLQYARHANKCAALLHKELLKIPEVRIMFPREANSVFLELPEAAVTRLEGRGWHFYTFIGVGGARFMCSWDTKKETIYELVHDIKEAVKGS